jgi:hypothetical protein
VYCSEQPSVSALTRTRLLCDRKASERGRRLYRAAARAGKYAGVFYGGY